MKRNLIVLFALTCLLLCACDSVIPTSITTAVPQSTPLQGQPTTPTLLTQPTTQPSPTQPTTVPAPVLDPLFAEMPQTYADLAEVYLTEHFAVFAFITAGMNSADTTVATYDLLTDTLLGQVSLGEDMYKIFPFGDGSFGVLSYYHATYQIYRSDCSLVSENEIPGVEGEIGIAGFHGNVILLSELMTGKVFVFDILTMALTETDLAPGVYQYVGAADSCFVLESYDAGLIRVAFDGKTEVLYKFGSAQVVGSTYVAGVRGDYVTMLPLLGGDALMAPCQSFGEIFVTADGVGLLSRTQNWDAPNSLYYYATDSMTVSTVPVDGQVVGAGLSGSCVVAVIRKSYSEPLQFMYVDTADYELVPIGKSAYDNGILNGAQPLPEPSGSDETVALINRIQNTYGVQLMYEPDFFDLELLGYSLEYTDEDTFRQRALLLESFLTYLPEGLLREMGQKAPVVIFLCQDVHPTAGGLHTFLNGYNVLFLSVTGTDDYFLNVAAHEMAHALELGMDAEIVAGWRELMPEDVRAAYEMPSLTVEFTPDDKGRTPVWFLEAYSRTSEKEDRAVLFAALYDAWKSDDYSILQHEGLKIKVNYWAQMLRATYDSCADYTFPWENR